MTEQNNTKVPAELIPAGDYPVVSTDAVMDKQKGKTQEDVNTEAGEKIEALEESVGSGGSVDTRIENAVNTEKARAENVEAQLSNEIDVLQKQDIVPVDSLPSVADADPKKIYRVVGTTSYTDYMVDTMAEPTAWKTLATYSFPGIDDEPTPESEKLVKSGGVAVAIENAKDDIRNGEDFISYEKINNYFRSPLPEHFYNFGTSTPESWSYTNSSSVSQSITNLTVAVVNVPAGTKFYVRGAANASRTRLYLIADANNNVLADSRISPAYTRDEHSPFYQFEVDCRVFMNIISPWNDATDGVFKEVHAHIDGTQDLQDDIDSLDERVGEIENEVVEIVTDYNETKYENVGEWEYYKELNKSTSFNGVGTYTPLLESDTLINCVCVPKITKRAIKYLIGYKNSIGYFVPSSQDVTILKTGSFAEVSEYESPTQILLDSPVTIPSGNSVFVLLYSEQRVYMSGGGNDTTSASPFNNKTPHAYFISNNSVWNDPWSETWSMGAGSVDRWTVCSPILKHIQQSEIKQQCEEVVSEILEEQIPTIINEINKVDIYLPNKFYAVVGDTLQLFFQGIVDVVNISDYDIYAICGKGKTYPRYFSYTPTVDDIGTNVLTIYVKDRKGNVIGQASCNIVTVAAPASPMSMKSIFTFGDSLTSGGEWPGEAKRRLVGNSTYDSITGKGLLNIDFFGYRNTVINEQSVDYFGVGGWTWASYLNKGAGGAFRFYVSGVSQLSLGATYTNNGHSYTIQEINVTGDTGNIRCTTSSNTNTPSTSGTLTKSSGDGDATIAFASYETENANPLWDDTNNKMSFLPYVHDCGASTIDAVYVLLSWNGQEAWKEYSVDDNTGHIANAKTFARTLHVEYPNAKLFIMGIQMPSDTGGLGANYGASGGYIDGYGLKKCALNYNKALQDLCNLDEFSPYCEFVAIAPQFDSHYNMPHYNTNVNIRSTIKEMLGSNGVHPSNSGYYQIADAVYRSIVANFCQNT